MIKIKGIIMSGGMGSRLRPLTCDLPKPMVPVFNRPLMEYSIDLLKKHGINKFGVTLYYLSNNIVEYFNDGHDIGCQIKYFIEDTPMGTGGSVKNAHEFLNKTFLVISGDGFTEIDLAKALEFHKAKKSMATLILKKESIPLEYGVVVTDENNRITRFLEKPSWGEVFSDTINTGIYILEDRVLDYYNKGDNFDFSKDLFPRLLKDDVPIYGYITNEYWNDIGNIKSYKETHLEIFKDKSKHYLIGSHNVDGVWIGDNSEIGKDVEIQPPVFIGNNTIIEARAKILPYTVIGNNCKIGCGSNLERSIIWDNVAMGDDNIITNAIICNNVKLKDNIQVNNNVTIGSYSHIYSNTSIEEDIMIWPYKTIYENVVVKDNLVKEEEKNRNIFTGRNISGEIDKTISLNTIVDIGSSFALSLKKPEKIVLVCDNTSISNLARDSISAGILSTGALSINIINGSLPITRYGIKHFNADGGVFIHLDNEGKSKIVIEFLDNHGGTINKDLKRKIENTLQTFNFDRFESYSIRKPIIIENFDELYFNYSKSYISNIKKIKEIKPKVLISSKSNNMSTILSDFLTNIGCQVNSFQYINNLTIQDMQYRIFSDNVLLGILIKENGEEITLIDEKSIIDDDKYFLLSLMIGIDSKKIKEVVIPYNYPRIAENLVKDKDGTISISKSDISHIQENLFNKRLEFQYKILYDGVLASGLIIDYLIDNQVKLSDLVKKMPKYHYSKRSIPCKREDKGSILRLLSQSEETNKETIEGVKFIKDKGWALIVPDDEKPIFNLYTEALTEEYADEISTFYEDKIKLLMRKE